MADFEFSLSHDDTARLFAIKALQGEHHLTGNEFAAQLLEAELRRLFPAVPRYDEEGVLLNADKYKAPAGLSNHTDDCPRRVN